MPTDVDISLPDGSVSKEDMESWTIEDVSERMESKETIMMEGLLYVTGETVCSSPLKETVGAAIRQRER